MSTDLSSTNLQSSSAGTHADARLALMQVVHATRADLAEMDRLLVRAERLISRGCSDRAAKSMPDRSTDPIS